MEEDVSLEQEVSKVPPSPRVKFRPYSYLVDSSRRMGYLAVRTLGSVREFLGQEVTLPKSRTTAKKAADDGLEDMKKVAARSHEVIDGAKTIFPFTLVPDSLVLDRTKITIIKRTLFSEDIISIRIEDVLNVGVHTGIFFGSLTIASRVMNSTDHFQINFLWVSDAHRLKKLIQGYVIAQHNNINVADLPKGELVRMLNELGEDQRA